jgi:four helix bundle protein
MPRDYRKLKTYHLADELVVQVYTRTKHFPQEETFGLKSQMRRAAVSIPANIAEGAGRRTLREYINFLGLASGSLSELTYYIELTRRLGYISTQDHSQLCQQAEETSRALHGLIQALEKKL